MPRPPHPLADGPRITREAAALVRVAGADRRSFLTRVMSGDLPPSGAAPTALLGPRGALRAVGVAAVLPDRIDLHCGAEEAEGLRAALDRYLIADDVTLEVAPAAATRIDGQDAPEAFAALPDGFLLRARRPWPSFVVVQEPPGGGAWEDGATPTSPEEAEWLRIAAGEPRWGFEADATSLPLQCGYAAHVRLGKGCYIGQEYVARQAHRGRVSRQLVGIAFDGAAAPPGAAVWIDGRDVGKLTSAASIPGSALGLALVAAGVPPGPRALVGDRPAAAFPLPFPEEALP